MRQITKEEHKTILLGMLEELDRFCEEQNIRYFMASGSLLGTIRHKGFIPWDDDVDVVMPRRDYQRFIETFASSKPYRVLSFETESRYYLQFAKMIAEDTYLKEPVDSDLSIGVYLDVFPLDNMSDDYDKAKALFDETSKGRRKIWLHNLVWLKQRPLYQNLAICAMKLFLFQSRESILKELDQQSRIYEADDFTAYAGVTISGTYGYKEIMKSEWYKDAVRMPFEGLSVRVPKGYDAILTQMYGDYMKLPEIEKQISRHTFEAWRK